MNMNAYVNTSADFSHPHSGVHIVVTITIGVPSLMDGVGFVRDVLLGTGTGGDVIVSSNISAHEEMVKHAMADALRSVPGLKVRR